jgi:hypothetical protein
MIKLDTPSKELNEFISIIRSKTLIFVFHNDKSLIAEILFKSIEEHQKKRRPNEVNMIVEHWDLRSETTENKVIEYKTNAMASLLNVYVIDVLCETDLVQLQKTDLYEYAKLYSDMIIISDMSSDDVIVRIPQEAILIDKDRHGRRRSMSYEYDTTTHEIIAISSELYA